MSKKNLSTIKPEKVDFSLLQAFISPDKKNYVFLIKNRLNVRSFIVVDLISKSVVRYLARDVSRASRRVLDQHYKIVPYLEGARALSSVLKLVDQWNEDKA